MIGTGPFSRKKKLYGILTTDNLYLFNNDQKEKLVYCISFKIFKIRLSL